MFLSKTIKAHLHTCVYREICDLFTDFLGLTCWLVLYFYYSSQYRCGTTKCSLIQFDLLMIF